MIGEIIRKENEIIMPIPEGISFSFEHPELGKPTKYWRYFDENHQLIGYICRWDTSSGKAIRPVCYTSQGWRCRGFPKPWKLYNLHLIYNNHNVPILICEGEKSADAGNKLFKEVISTTPMHGALSVNGTDWSILKDREVIICPDLDEAGKSFAKKVREKCEEVRVRSIDILNLESIQNELKCEKIKGFDLANAYEMGWRHSSIHDLLTEAPFNPHDVMPKGFLMRNCNIYYQKEKQDEVEEIFLCSYLVVKYKTRDFRGFNWGYLLEIRDNDNVTKELAVPARILAGDGLELRQLLLDNGLNLAAGCNKTLHQYIVSSKPKRHIRCVTQTGWTGNFYVLPERVYKYKEREEIRLQKSSHVFINYEIEKSLQEWQEEVGRYAKNNINMLFVISLALSAPLIHLVNMENIAVHFVGQSSIGKTTLLNLASSVWGNSIHNWRTTDNAAESIAELSNDGLLLFDELGQVDGEIGRASCRERVCLYV